MVAHLREHLARRHRDGRQVHHLGEPVAQQRDAPDREGARGVRGDVRPQPRAVLRLDRRPPGPSRHRVLLVLDRAPGTARAQHSGPPDEGRHPGDRDVDLRLRRGGIDRRGGGTRCPAARHDPAPRRVGPTGHPPTSQAFRRGRRRRGVGRVISARGLSKTYRTKGDDTLALDEVTIDVDSGQFYVLLGPSGSGKTTMLRCLAGLETPDRGTILVDGWTVMSSDDHTFVPAERRPIGMVFQSYALWPTMDVTKNVSLPLRHGARGVPKDQVADRVKGVLDLLHLSPMARRPVQALSGGQQQRVALARALALEPAVLLMDEPLSNLDVQLRAELRIEIKSLTRRLGITAVYVTHDQADAMVMADVACVMNAGRVLQQGTPSDLYREPADLFVAGFLGELNRIDGKVRSCDDRSCEVETPLGTFTARRDPGVDPQAAVVLGIRLEAVRWSDAPGPNRFEATVLERMFMGGDIVYRMVAGDHSLRVRRTSAGDDIPATDSPVFVEFPHESLTAFPST
ncbi:MAG: ATP-binding cassette domain-containing protein [Streptosporangiales bacterium]|nr:ATP-binding cassette domain-containing protein [Streptosporangiales bacterium]